MLLPRWAFPGERPTRDGLAAKVEPDLLWGECARPGLPSSSPTLSQPRMRRQVLPAPGMFGSQALAL